MSTICVCVAFINCTCIGIKCRERPRRVSLSLSVQLSLQILSRLRFKFSAEHEQTRIGSSAYFDIHFFSPPDDISSACMYYHNPFNKDTNTHTRTHTRTHTLCIRVYFRVCLCVCVYAYIWMYVSIIIIYHTLQCLRWAKLMAIAPHIKYTQHGLLPFVNGSVILAEKTRQASIEVVIVRNKNKSINRRKEAKPWMIWIFLEFPTGNTRCKRAWTGANFSILPGFRPAWLGKSSHQTHQT